MTIVFRPEDDGGGSAVHKLWGIDWVPGLWATRIRILFVIDGRITTGYGPEEFGLGQVIDTLRNRSFAWWVRFSVQVVDRDAPQSFRFTQDGFDIDNFDQVWFFGDWPGPLSNNPEVGDDVIGQDQNSPLDDVELRIIAEWMERGGGVFAAGDHSLLGASMCSRIPRVRKMRRWRRDQQVPPFAADDRHETLVHDPQSGELTWEGDRWPQQIFPVYRSFPNDPTFFHRFPHPLLCGKAGVIDRFPDHMHEGAVIEDDQVVLDEPLGIPGFGGEEFPAVELVVGTLASHVPQPFGVRPRPQVIAHGLTTNDVGSARRFALIGVYDGDPVEIGRVVVDSTWHHWFSMNLVGFQAEAPGLYAGMQQYYRNVALWLSTPAQRAWMLFAATWGVLIGKHPGAFDAVMGIWELGARVVDVIGRTAPQCIVGELVNTFLRAPAPQGTPGPSKPSRGQRWPPVTLVNEAIVGGIALELLPLAQYHIIEKAYGRTVTTTSEEIRRKGLYGVSTGFQSLVATMREGSALLDSYSQNLGPALKRPTIAAMPISDEAVPHPLAESPVDQLDDLGS